MNSTSQRAINRLQENLTVIRKIAGWTAEELGEKIGVTKQTISNLENKKNPMSLTQYIALRAIFDYEISEHPENVALAQTVLILLDSDDITPDEQDTNQKNNVATVAASTGIAVSAGAAAAVGTALFGGPALGAAALLGCVGSVGWMAKLMKKDIEKDTEKRK